MSFLTIPFQEKIEKPWGSEIIYTRPEDDKVGKLILVKAGKRISFQYHDEKTETQCLISGSCLIWLENEAGGIEKIPMELHKGYFITTGQKHRLEAIEDSWIIEVSTKETGNTFRIEDDYQRPTETEDLRHKPNRGWLT